DGIISSLALQWANHPAHTLHECARVTRPGGKAVIATLGPRTLQEMAAAFDATDGNPRVNAFPTRAEFNHAATASGWQVDHAEEHIIVDYHPDLPSLMRSLKNIGAQSHASARSGLTAPAIFQDAEAHYRARHGSPQGLPATWEIYLFRMTRV